MADKPSTLELKVNLDCKCCYKKIQKILCKIQVEESIATISYDDKNNTVTISGPFDPHKLSQKLRCKAGKLIIEITIVPPVEKTPTVEKTPPPITEINIVPITEITIVPTEEKPPPPPAKPLEVNVNVKFDPPIQVCCPCKPSSCGGGCCSKSSCGGNCCSSKPSCGGGCYCSKPSSCGGSSCCYCRIIPCLGHYPPLSYGGLPFFQFTIEDI